ncbi:MAG: hypothetical protein QOH25_3135 [Acidobacteriota bacterium]|nr:hypothetical protein [Acidobacteriota bacterium]
MIAQKMESEVSDDLDILSSIWIFSCNVDDPIIMYEVVENRINPPASVNVRELVHSRGELFRRTIPPHRLEAWKQEMLKGKHLPSLLRNIEDEPLRKKKIEAITSDDVFTNQYRVDSSDNAPLAPVEILDWGLKHIDRLREARIEKREESYRKWGSKWLPLLSTLVALVTVVSTGYFQNENIQTQARLKYYEVELKPKQEGYDQFMGSVIRAGDNAFKNDHTALTHALTDMELAYYKLIPFLEEKNKTRSDLMWEKLQQFTALCYKIEDPMAKSEIEANTHSFLEYKKYFQSELSQILFKD